MASFKFRGTDDYILKLRKLADQSEATVKKALYEGAGVVADEIRNSIKSIPKNDNTFGTTENPVVGLNGIQKAGLMDGLGISQMETSEGTINVKISFDGYNAMKTKKYPKGQPNILIARSIESGTSFRQKYPFVRKAVNKSRKKAQEAMQNVIDEEASKIMK